ALSERVAERPPGEGDAQEGLALDEVHREQVALGGDEVVAPARRAGYVEYGPRGVPIQRPGPLVGGERTGGPAQMQAEPGKSRVLLGDRHYQRLAFRVGPQRPAHLRQPVPRGDERTGEGEVTRDLGEGQFGDRLLVLVRRPG